ncbi:MAG: ABC transporter permease [Egibacteraceae bacterium]
MPWSRIHARVSGPGQSRGDTRGQQPPVVGQQVHRLQGLHHPARVGQDDLPGQRPDQEAGDTAHLNAYQARGSFCPVLVRSLQIGILATIFSTLLGTLIAFALVRHRFRGRAATNLLIFLPMATPEVVMGSSLLALFLNLGVRTGFATILIGHIMFNISFVVVTVKARLQGMDSRLEEAAMDLYADEVATFVRVTLPPVTPGIIAASLLAFALSFDDFIITNFNAGNTLLFPMFVWGAAQRGVPPEINVIGTAMFGVALAALIVGQLARRLQRRPVGSAAQAERPPAGTGGTY